VLAKFERPFKVARQKFLSPQVVLALVSPSLLAQFRSDGDLVELPKRLQSLLHRLVSNPQPVQIGGVVAYQVANSLQVLEGFTEFRPQKVGEKPFGQKSLERDAEQTVADFEAVVKEGEGLVRSGSFNPQGHFRQINGKGVFVHAVEAMVGDQKFARCQSPFVIVPDTGNLFGDLGDLENFGFGQIGVLPLDFVEALLVASQKFFCEKPACGDQKVTASHGWVNDLDLQQLFGRFSFSKWLKGFADEEVDEGWVGEVSSRLLASETRPKEDIVGLEFLFDLQSLLAATS
jgi:hypothetical protein